MSDPQEKPQGAIPATGDFGSADRVRMALEGAGIAVNIRFYPASTRTAAEAAAAIGCGVAQIAKSLIFRAMPSERPVLVIASGAHRVDESRIESVLGERSAKADAAYVRRVTGFAIGGVAPVGHLTPPVTFLDASLAQFAEIWAAAGTANAVFCVTYAQLQQLTAGRAITISDETVAIE
jgi:prolyl-tRNA editing enzyme YbaK/EbsC (Cys-tRNA(Pro) deacylase)